MKESRSRAGARMAVVVLTAFMTVLAGAGVANAEDAPPPTTDTGTTAPTPTPTPTDPTPADPTAADPTAADPTAADPAAAETPSDGTMPEDVSGQAVVPAPPVAAPAPQAAAPAPRASDGAIEGVVTRQSDGSPVGSAQIEVDDKDGTRFGTATTDAAGRYRVDALPVGSYTVRFSADETLLREFWDGASSVLDATLVSVADGQTVTGIDASLQAAGLISGSVTRLSDGAPAVGKVTASNKSGFFVADIDAQGQYTLSVPAGTYVIEFVSGEAGVAGEFWRNVHQVADATPVSVSTGGHVTGVDAELEGTALIRGTVSVDSTSSPIVSVEALDGDRFVAMAYADADGTYQLAVPPGTYTLRASALSLDEPVTIAPQYYDHVATAAEATPVTVAAGDARAGIDFALADTDVPAPPATPAPKAASSTGTLAATGGDLPVPGLVLALMLLAAGGVLISRRKSAAEH